MAELALFHTIAECRRYRRGIPAGSSVLFVPTMGALHEGHVALVRYARERADGSGPAGSVVLASIFVNPTQFGPGEDFNKYPRTLDTDLSALRAAGADGVLAPTAAEMYPQNNSTLTGATENLMAIDPGPLATVLEGAVRPGHFQGVCTVVAKLLNIVQPTHLIMGQKDYQQAAVLRQMLADLNFPVELVRRPTVREADGLAMSSRNRYLSAEERARAPAISEALSWAKGQYDGGERVAEVLNAGMRERITGRGLEVQYALACDARTLATWQGSISGPCVLLVAAKLGKTRLIDNLVLADM